MRKSIASIVACVLGSVLLASVTVGHGQSASDSIRSSADSTDPVRVDDVKGETQRDVCSLDVHMPDDGVPQVRNISGDWVNVLAKSQIDMDTAAKITAVQKGDQLTIIAKIFNFLDFDQPRDVDVAYTGTIVDGKFELAHTYKSIEEVSCFWNQKLRKYLVGKTVWITGEIPKTPDEPLTLAFAQEATDFDPNGFDLPISPLGYRVSITATYERAAPKPTYPDYTIVLPPTVPRVITWGTGLPGPQTDDWSRLVPKEVIDQYQINGRWIIMAVYGQNLFGAFKKDPPVTWAPADKHLDYKLLYSGSYVQDRPGGADGADWSGFWKAFEDRLRPEPLSPPPSDVQGADVYVLAVHLEPNTWAGHYEFKLGNLRVEWVLPNATNLAKTSFIREVGLGKTVPGWVGALSVDTDADGNKVLYEHVDTLFKYDRFHVEVETSGDVVTTDKIPIELFRSQNSGDPKELTFGKHVLFAERVKGSKRLFRTPLIRLNEPESISGSATESGERVYWIPLALGDKLAARVGPYDVARQDDMAVAQMYATPDKVGAFYRGYVAQAAKIAGVELPTDIDRVSDGVLYNQVLNKKWDTVDSKPFVRVGGRSIDLTVEHLAGMLLVRDQFIRSMTEALPRIQKMREQMRDNPKAWGHAIWAFLRDDAAKPGSPIGDMKVLGWDPARGTSTGTGTVPFRNAYDEDWLNKTFRGSLGQEIQWQEDSAMFVFNGYVDTAEQALQYAQSFDVSNPDAKKLLLLTTVGMRAMVARARPNLLHLIEDPDGLRRTGIGFRWEYDRYGRQSLALLGDLGDEFLRNEARVDAINNATSFVLTLASFFAPETTVGAIFSVGSTAASAWMTLTRNLPEFLGREADVQFAIGAYLAVGEQHYVAAKVRTSPGWQVALDVVNTAVDVVSTIALLRDARAAWIAGQPDSTVVQAFAGGAESFLDQPTETQKFALARYAELVESKTLGNPLTEVEQSIVENGDKTLTALADRKPRSSFRYMDDAALDGRVVTVTDEGKVGFIFPEGTSLTRTLREGDSVTLVDVARPEPWRIPTAGKWDKFEVQGSLGRGSFAQVFDVKADLRLKQLAASAGVDSAAESFALKVYKAGPEGVADIERALQAEKLLADAGIRQLKIIDHGVGPDGLPYLVQEIMPFPGIYRPVEGQLMEEGMQRALLGLYKKLADKGIAFSDGHKGNIFFEKMPDGTYTCGILDQDRVWKYGEGLHTGAFDQEGLATTLEILEDPCNADWKSSRIFSLEDSTYSPRAHLLLHMGYCPWPNDEYFTMKMLEHRGWIKFKVPEPGVPGHFESDRLDMKVVKEFFPKIDDPANINTKFDVPAHLQHLVGPPPELRSLATELRLDDLLPIDLRPRGGPIVSEEIRRPFAFAA